MDKVAKHAKILATCVIIFSFLGLAIALLDMGANPSAGQSVTDKWVGIAEIIVVMLAWLIPAFILRSSAKRGAPSRGANWALLIVSILVLALWVIESAITGRVGGSLTDLIALAIVIDGGYVQANLGKANVQNPPQN
ncbi:MAG: hypothetical protein LBM73_01745 [Candidatus Nomurabacteria bacterium]|jgi:hypothetical protein|nr:hypothetical protein [Candidatus Nomurabacteria bacterium]